MESLSCHSNDITLATAIKSINLANISAKFQLFSPYGFWGDDFLFGNLAFRLPWQPIKFRDLDKNNMFGRGLLEEHFYKILSKYLRGAWWLSGRVSDSGARGRGFETYRRRVVSLSKTLYSPKVLVNYPGSGGSVPIWLKNCWLGR